MAPTSETAAKTRLTARATPAQDRLLRRAAAASGRSLSAFLVESACAAAAEVLVRHPDLPAENAELQRMLEILQQPPGNLPELKALLNPA